MSSAAQKKSRRRSTRTGRRHPLATVALIAIGLLFTGGAYALFNSTSSGTEAVAASQDQVDRGGKLFSANCATCHGMNLQGTGAGPSLLGVGAASVDFQVGTGRMPLQNTGPQAPEKPPSSPRRTPRPWPPTSPPSPRARDSPTPSTSTARATPPTAPSSSGSTAPCATTWQGQEAR